MAEETKQDYLSLFEAAKLCPYSEAYLRLRARQGKLKSIKIGKKWMTTKDWVDDYVMKSQEWNEKIAAKREKKELAVPSPDKIEYMLPNIVAQPAGTYAVPQIEFTSLAKQPAITIPQAPRTINYANPQFLFVLGSSAMMALLLFVWMTADFHTGYTVGGQLGQASLTSGVKLQANLPPKNESFELQMDPQTLEKALSQNQEGQPAAVDQAQIILPEPK